MPAVAGWDASAYIARSAHDQEYACRCQLRLRHADLRLDDGVVAEESFAAGRGLGPRQAR